MFGSSYNTIAKTANFIVFGIVFSINYVFKFCVTSNVDFFITYVTNYVVSGFVTISIA